MVFLKALLSLLKLSSLKFVIAAMMLQSCFTLQLLASELELRPRVAIGYQSYRLEVGSNNRDYEAEYLFGGLGFSARHERFYVDFYGQTNLTEAEDELQSSSDSIAKFESEIDRTEFNATLGSSIVIDVFTGQGQGGNVGLARSGHLGGLASGLDRVGYTLGIDYSLLDFRSGGDTLYDEETIRTRTELSYRC